MKLNHSTLLFTFECNQVAAMATNATSGLVVDMNHSAMNLLNLNGTDPSKFTAIELLHHQGFNTLDEHLEQCMFASEVKRTVELEAITSPTCGTIIHLLIPSDRLAMKVNKLANLINVDFITGLMNKSDLIKQLRVEASSQARFKTSLSLLLVEISNLSEIAGGEGQPSTIEVLRTIGDKIQRCCRLEDRIGVIEQGVFGLILCKTDSKQANQLAARFETVLCRQPNQLNVPVKVNVATYEINPQQQDPWAILDAATALLAEKGNDAVAKTVAPVTTNIETSVDANLVTQATNQGLTAMHRSA